LAAPWKCRCLIPIRIIPFIPGAARKYDELLINEKKRPPVGRRRRKSVRFPKGLTTGGRRSFKVIITNPDFDCKHKNKKVK
jgi:hypothetical protein